MKLEFEWHDAKAEANLRAHDVSFELAKTVFRDPFAIEWLDEREDYARNVSSLSGWQNATSCYFSPIRNAGSAFASFQPAG
jgi:uncharacterized DUF497 family protein